MPQPCGTCGEPTDAVVDINFRKVPLCDSCCMSIAHEVVDWLIQQKTEAILGAVEKRNRRLASVVRQLNEEIRPGVRWCDGCERHAESHEFRQVEEDEVCRQFCHRHFQG